MLELRKFVAPEFVFGADARLLAGRYAKNFGVRRVLVVTDAGVSAAGWAGDVLRSLEDEGLECRVFDQLSPNPRDHEVMAGVEAYRQHECHALVAVGGGSAIDCAKGIGIVATNGAQILAYEGVDRVQQPMPPLICVPTTGGASADVSQFAIINNTTDRVKVAIISKAVVPDVALIDPVTLTSLDPYLTACTGMDALVHAIEAFVSNASSPLTDVHAIEAIRLVRAHLADCVAEPQNLEHRGAVMLGSLQAGLAFSNASLGCVHALAHSLGGYLDLPHGECNALVLAPTVDFNFSAAPERFLHLGGALGLDWRGMGATQCKDVLVGHLASMRQGLGIAGTLEDRGLRSSDIGVLARKALRDPCNATNPRPPNQRDLEVIIEGAM